MPISLHELRLSFIWMESLLALFTADARTAPMAFLSRKAPYKQEFASVQSHTSAWTAPWPPVQGRHIHHFWNYYLQKMPEQISGDHAWKYVVPLRSPIRVATTTPWLPGRLTLEGFYYPHAVALVLTVIITETLALEAMVDKALEARADGKYSVRWADGSTQSLSLDVLAAQLLDQLREHVLGRDATQGGRSHTPFTIATVVRGDGVDPTQPNPPMDTVHRALEGLCSWHRTWKHDVLHDWEALTCLKIRHAPPSHVMYGLERGRAVWYPDLFTAQGKVHSLGCYHRNLTLLSLQTESLIALMRVAGTYIDASLQMPLAMEELAKHAAGILGRLYGGTQDTYQSWSSRAQIDANHAADALNKVRDFFNMGGLF
jgi:hypothetical protein